MPSEQFLLLLIAFAVAGEVHSAAPVKAVPTQLKPASVTLHIDASGLPSGFACEPALPAPTCAAITAAASRWRYAPGTSEGKPTAMKARMSLNLQAIPKAGGFALMATGASIGEAGSLADDAAAAEKQYAPPRYPRDAQLRGQEGLVVLELWFEPGTDRASIRNAWLNGQKPRRRSDLVDAATAAAKKWKMEPHAPKVLSVCVPFAFTLLTPFPSQDTAPCQPTYVEGYKPPQLLTKPAQMVF